MGRSSMATVTSSLTSEAFLMSTSGPFPITISLTPIMIMDTTCLPLCQVRSMLLGYPRLFFQKQTILIINLLLNCENHNSVLY